MNQYTFRYKMAVRDYECDMHRIVNNSVYLGYLEHVRHEYLKGIGIDFKEYTLKGIDLIVIRAEVDYKQSLSSGDEFWVGLNLARESKVRFTFYQDIYRSKDDKLILKGKIIETAWNSKGRPRIPKEILEHISAPKF
ncbi:MAG: acyl-CoA thioesterase [Gammaproteobacteria bacterium]|nr:acyl-CoA thioesterase [Gammaproteobacteria bacterium]NNJ84860.1 acyl-CoA thioesterase [Gammaproteobacteria bacterium]